MNPVLGQLVNFSTAENSWATVAQKWSHVAYGQSLAIVTTSRDYCPIGSLTLTRTNEISLKKTISAGMNTFDENCFHLLEL